MKSKYCCLLNREFTKSIIQINGDALEFEIEKNDYTGSQIKTEAIIKVHNLTSDYVGVRVCSL